MKSHIFLLLTLVCLTGCAPSSIAPSAVNTKLFVFVKIPESIDPLERGSKYEDPLEQVLKKEAVGEVTGGGSSMSRPDEQGKSTIEWVGVDVDLVDSDRGLPILKRELLRLGAPPATILEYEKDGKLVEEKLQ